MFNHSVRFKRSLKLNLLYSFTNQMADDSKILYGGPEPEFIGKVRSLGGWILEKLTENSGGNGLIEANTGFVLTATEIKRQSIELAQCLKTAGMKPGDVVGLCCDNRREYPIPLISTLLIGCSFAPLNQAYTERELDHALKLSKPKYIFASKKSASTLLNVKKYNNFIKEIIVFDDEKIPGTTYYSDFLAKFGRPQEQENFKSAIVPLKEQVAFILCSSGTTGLPKGVELTYNNVLTCVGLLSEGYANSPIPNVTMFGVLPWFHAYGCLTLLSVACSGVNLVYLPKFDDRAFLSAIEKYKVHVIFMVPPLMVFLAKSPLVDEYDLSSVMLLLCGAAPLSQELKESIQKRIGIPMIREAYGLSEGTLTVLRQTPEYVKPGSVGRLHFGYWGKVVDPDTGVICGANQRGELWVKGSQVMKGYVNDPEATRNAIDKDGFLHTGDIVYYDEEGDFFVVDRLKELIKYKAFQVPPAELEGILLTNSKISDAAVVGLPDEDAGELPLAFIVKQKGVDVTEDEIIKFVSEKVSSAKRLRGGVRFVDSIPKNPSGKIMRRKLRDLLKHPKAKL